MAKKGTAVTAAPGRVTTDVFISDAEISTIDLCGNARRRLNAFIGNYCLGAREYL
jgi:hypothetical protein